MNKIKLFLTRVFTVFVTLGVLASPAHPCSAFKWTLNGRDYVAKSYDWFSDMGHGAVFINKRDVSKQAAPISEGRPLEWTSRYMNATFNQFGREFPMGGMNEKGLVIEILQLSESELIPASDPRPYVNESQWIQYSLDTFASTAELVEHLAEIRVASIVVGAHYFVCDLGGDCAVVEYLKGVPVAHRGLPVAAITNSTYPASLAYFNTHAGEVLPGYGSLNRFLRIGQGIRVEQTAAGREREAVYGLLSRVWHTSTMMESQWNIVYEPAAGVVSFRTRQAYGVKEFSLSAMDPSCAAPVRMADMSAVGAAGAVQFQDYTSQANEELILKNDMDSSSKFVPMLITFPEKYTVCRK